MIKNVGELVEYLASYDSDVVVKMKVADHLPGISIVKEIGFISVSTEEVYGKEIVIHPMEEM